MPSFGAARGAGQRHAPPTFGQTRAAPVSQDSSCIATKPKSIVLKMARPIGIDLFSGVGGMSLGFEQAGFDVVGAVEYDPIHAAAHKFNFPQWAVLPRSVVGLSGRP